MTRPLVSVVLPVFNAEATIRRALQSLLDQTYRPLEVIVVDDGSTDDSVAIVEQFSDPCIRLIQQSHQGVYAAANIGFAQSKGEYVARMDADDISYPDRIEKQWRLLQSSGADVVGCQVRIVDGNGQNVAGMHRYQNWVNTETRTETDCHALRFVEFPIVNPTILARRRYFDLQFTDDEFPEDYDLFLRAIQSGLRATKVPEVLFDWIDSSDRLTRTHARYTDDAFMGCRRHHLLKGPLFGVSSVDVWGVGKTGKPWIRWLQDQSVSVRRIYDVSPRKLGKTIHGVLVQSFEDLQTNDGTPLIIAVGASGTRLLIRQHVENAGFVVGLDAWFVA